LEPESILKVKDGQKLLYLLNLQHIFQVSALTRKQRCYGLMSNCHQNMINIFRLATTTLASGGATSSYKDTVCWGKSWQSFSNVGKALHIPFCCRSNLFRAKNSNS